MEAEDGLGSRGQGPQDCRMENCMGSRSFGQSADRREAEGDFAAAQGNMGWQSRYEKWSGSGHS